MENDDEILNRTLKKSSKKIHYERKTKNILFLNENIK